MARGPQENNLDQLRGFFKGFFPNQSPHSALLLPKPEIEQRLERGEIFQKGSWDSANIRAAAYDLRMANNLMLFPGDTYDRSGSVGRDGWRTRSVHLKPGEVAFVTTREQICLPWDLVGHVGMKFSFVSQGILMITGDVIDPGYGLQPTRSGGWEAKEDVRLNFLLANVGPDEVELRPGEEHLATIQFFAIPPASTKIPVRSPGGEQIEKTFFKREDDKSGLEFFIEGKRELEKFRQKLDGFTGRIDAFDTKVQELEEFERRLNGFTGRVNAFDTKVEQFEKTLNVVQSGSNQIVMFGVYLLCATILGVSLATILTAIPNVKLEDFVGSSVALFVTAFFASIGLLAMGWLAFLVVRRLRHSDGGDGSGGGNP